MNFQISPVLTPLKVLVINPLTPTAQMVIVKILSGAVFGNNQLIDIILLVYSNEKSLAEIFKMELKCCALACVNSIQVSNDLPSISDVDVFCFISTLKNPNRIDFDVIDVDEFDALYLLIKIANHLVKPEPLIEEVDDGVKFVKRPKEVKKRKSIFVADGVVAMDILYTMSHDLPRDIFFCPSPLSAIAKSVLGEYLKVKCDEINKVLVWGANDEVFYIDIEKPIIISDKIGDVGHCDWKAAGKKQLETFEMDHTQFNESWMKKEFIDKVSLSASKNPYGSIYKASEFVKTLQIIWKSRLTDGVQFRSSMGVISDGSLDTLRGCPYLLPLIFAGDSWSVDKYSEDSSFLRQEIKRINKSVKENHKKLKKYCKKFLQDNIIDQAFVHVDDDDSVALISIDQNNTPNNNTPRSNRSISTVL